MANPVGDLLRVEDIALDCEVPNREALFARLAPMLVRNSRPNEAEVLDGLAAREKLGSTAVGHGIAIPHARMPQCVAPAAALVRTRNAIPFNAPDGKSVDLFLGLIVPNQANQYHLKILASAAEMFSDRAFREALRGCADSGKLLELIRAWPRPPQ